MRKIQIEYTLFKKTIKEFNHLFKGYSQSNFGNFIDFYYISKKNIYLQTDWKLYEIFLGRFKRSLNISQP